MTLLPSAVAEREKRHRSTPQLPYLSCFFNASKHLMFGTGLRSLWLWVCTWMREESKRPYEIAVWRLSSLEEPRLPVLPQEAPGAS